MSIKKLSYIEHMQRISDEFFAETGRTTASTHEIADWAISNKKWQPPKNLVAKKCREDFARALRQEYIREGTGRPVRAKHAARIKRNGEQLTLWADIRHAPRKHMERAFQQRREQIVGDCCQLDVDERYYNRHHEDSAPLQTVFDFRDDVEEARSDET